MFKRFMCCLVFLNKFCPRAADDYGRLGYLTGSVVAKKLGCQLKIKLKRLKKGVKCPLCFTDSSPAKNPADDCRFFSQ